jgi:endo-1,4-beta-D-glucanase Y
MASTTGPITSTMLASSDPNYATCDKWDMEVKTTAAHTNWGAGFGTSLNQVMPPPATTATTSKTKNPYDVSAFDGISFNIKSGSGSAPPIWFELATLNNQPQPDGSIKTSDGTASGTAQAPSSNGTDEYNTRGMLLKNIGTSWTKVYVPFKVLGPRYLPAGTTCSNTSVMCQAPVFKATDVLGLQFAGYTQFGTNAGTFDVVVDDVALYTGSNGLGPYTAGALAEDGASLGSCKKPTGATMEQLRNMYANWKATFVTPCGSGNCVMRPENQNDVVSEGIAYGMLIAVNMNDRTLFDALWSFEQGHKAAGNLMTWCLGSQKSGGMGSACSQSGGSATDADEDMAFALIVAGKQWGGSYASTAATVIGDIYSNDMDTSKLLPTGGSNYGKDVASHVTNPSYFAPAYYKVFATIDTSHSSQWNSIAANSYTAINALASSSGLLPAWCQTSCTKAGSNGGADDMIYQYDAHRVAWRLGLDACWNGSTSGSTFLTNNAKFFATQSAQGIGRAYDIYTLTGAANSDAAQNSMSAIGTAGVGAMAVGNAFASTAYQFILDASYSPASTIADSSGHLAYSYFNATVGLLTALTMSGNFNH